MTAGAVTLPRAWFPPVLDHRDQPTCTAAVVTALAAYQVRRLTGLDWTPSVLFNYVTSRMISGHGRLRGSRLDWAFAAWHRFGLPSEADWPFSAAQIDRIPTKACFLRAKAFRGIGYRRLDTGEQAPGEPLARIRAAVGSGTPVSLEFPLNPAQLTAMDSGRLPMLPDDAKVFARHVVLVTGYDDNAYAGTEPGSGEELTGALLVRNSWGTGWGDEGYGWLPYRYCDKGLTSHHWTVELGQVSGERTVG
ncbi:hypothetical protein CFP75_00770 [Amycolatopsis alba DSM 44262]|uniref:Peptidase C1A papain C-terminal domain-containing protein n=2 Tax=Amycolatopsis alba TaxID=76020 RepID=A0A229S9Q6_AMYAL|nr:hypothetical protein CFP75_00770 [Amycolatopsis alba DSM 44262]